MLLVGRKTKIRHNTSYTMKKILLIIFLLNSFANAQNITLQPEKVVTKSLQITENAGNGKVLISDNVGNANWLDVSQFRSGFSAYAKSNQTFPADFPKPILFDTESFDTNNNFENSSFTAREAGFYFFGANLSWQATLHTGISWHGVVVEMKVIDLSNNSKTISSSTLPLTTNFITTHQISSLVNLKAGDKVSLTIASLGSTASILKLVNDFAGSSFYGYRVF